MELVEKVFQVLGHDVDWDWFGRKDNEVVDKLEGLVLFVLWSLFGLDLSVLVELILGSNYFWLRQGFLLLDSRVLLFFGWFFTWT